MPHSGLLFFFEKSYDKNGINIKKRNNHFNTSFKEAATAAR